MAYKSSSILEDVEYTLYIIHAVYQTTGVEIIMDSDAESFANFDSDFLFFLKNLFSFFSQRHQPIIQVNVIFLEAFGNSSGKDIYL